MTQIPHTHLTLMLEIYLSRHSYTFIISFWWIWSVHQLGPNLQHSSNALIECPTGRIWRPVESSPAWVVGGLFLSSPTSQRLSRRLQSCCLWSERGNGCHYSMLIWYWHEYWAQSPPPPPPPFSLFLHSKFICICAGKSFPVKSRPIDCEYCSLKSSPASGLGP